MRYEEKLILDQAEQFGGGFIAFLHSESWHGAAGVAEELLSQHGRKFV
jgi:hypothetical protein